MTVSIITIETPSLGDRTYLAHDGQVAVVVDPQRDIDRVLTAADEAGVRITHVLETHVHNDYVTGGLALARATGAVYALSTASRVSLSGTFWRANWFITCLGTKSGRWGSNRTGSSRVHRCMSKRRTTLFFGACVPAAMLLAGCGGSGAASPAVTKSVTRPAAAGSGVTYTVVQYKLPALTVAPGTKVTVVDGDDEPHTVTADGGAFDTGSFDKTNPGSFTAPSKPGSYAIHCKIHPSMHGTIIVR